MVSWKHLWTFSIASFCSQITFFSCGGHGGSCVYCMILISGYVIEKCVRNNIHYSFFKFPQLEWCKNDLNFSEFG